MAAVGQGSPGSTTRAVLTAYVGQAGRLVDPVSLSWVVNEIATDDHVLDPQPVGDGVVDLVNDRRGLGFYGAAWDVPADEPEGLHEILWTATYVDGSSVTWRREFDVLVKVGSAPQRGYALVSDFRTEGFSKTKYSDARIMAKIAQWSDFIDRVTHRFFEPRPSVMMIDGTGRNAIGLGAPVIALNGVTLSDDFTPDTLDLASLYVYNRHLTENLTDPDDRQAPRIAWVSLDESLIPAGGGYYAPSSCRFNWPRGRANVSVDGLFGYTDYDGSTTGKTPDLIRQACKLLVVRDLPTLSDVGSRQDAQDRYRLTSERTREQSYTLGARGSGGVASVGTAYFTGDPEIDGILEMFCAGPAMGSV